MNKQLAGLKKEIKNKQDPKRPLCNCGNLVSSKGKGKYRTVCYHCHMKGKRLKKDYCELCGFVAIDSVQLDVDHKDGNKGNNKASNLWTLCANCHRLKTKAKNDWRPQSEKMQQLLSK